MPHEVGGAGEIVGSDNLIGISPIHISHPDRLAIALGIHPVSEQCYQRGVDYPRVVGQRADIGALQRGPDTIFANGFD